MHGTFTNSLKTLPVTVFGVILYPCVPICHTLPFYPGGPYCIICDPLELYEMII